MPKGCMYLTVVVAVVLAGAEGVKYLTRQQFDAALWRESGTLATESWPRLEMADDLLRRRMLEGISEDSLVALLGPRPDTDYFRDWDYVYWLGPERGRVRIDSEWLVIRLDSTRHVMEAAIVRD